MLSSTHQRTQRAHENSIRRSIVNNSIFKMALMDAVVSIDDENETRISSRISSRIQKR